MPKGVVWHRARSMEHGAWSLELGARRQGGVATTRQDKRSRKQIVKKCSEKSKGKGKGKGIGSALSRVPEQFIISMFKIYYIYFMLFLCVPYFFVVSSLFTFNCSPSLLAASGVLAPFRRGRHFKSQVEWIKWRRRQRLLPLSVEL